LTSYVEVLISGKSKASATGQPLGNKFFQNTKGQCVDTKSGQKKERYIYVNNVPAGNIPFISSGMGVNFSEFRGLIPGVISNANAFNPATLVNAFLTGTTPPCQEITMQTIDNNNKKSNETHFVSLIDIKGMDPCSFSNKTNPQTNQKCVNTFTTMKMNNRLNTDYSYDSDDTSDDSDDDDQLYPKIPDSLFAKVYVASLGCLGIYITYRAMIKMKLIPELY
jgi:hypothetical protein